MLTLHDPGIAKAYYEQGLWQRDTFYSLLARHSAKSPEKTALRDGRQSLSWQNLKARVDGLADDLADEEIVAGDRVSLWMSNRLEAIVAFLACSREGIACNPSLHRSHTCAEVIQLLAQLRAKAVVTEAGWGADRSTSNFEQLLTELPHLRKVYAPERFPSQDVSASLKQPHGNPDSIAYLAFTSGTTGVPKCVMHSSNTLLANARDLVRDWSLDASAVILSLSPVSHHIAWVAFAQWLVCGGQLVTDYPPPGTSRLDWIIQSEATYVLGVPTHAMDILAEQRRRSLSQMGRVRTFSMAGAPIPQVVAEAFLEQGITPQNIYGMTECSSHQYTHPTDPRDVWISTCGRGGRAYEARIWDPEAPDRELPTGQTGEIGGRGAALMLGYFANQVATEQSFNRHGYLMSGDLGSFDTRGNLRIEGRAKDLIIRGGHNIFPARIESCALTHPAVARVAAFGVADERLGEKVCLAVVGSVSAAEMLQHLGVQGLSKYDMPEWFLALNELPLTASGKVLKRELVRRVAHGELRPEPVRYGTLRNVE